MIKTTYQTPEIRDANDNIIQQGAFGKNTALANSTNDGWIDYVANDLEFLYDLAKDEVVPVPSLPASGQLNKTYLLTTTGVSYRWSGTQWVAVSSSEAVGRAESAALLAEQWATKTSGTVDGTEYSAKYYAGLAEASADDAQDVADDMATHLVQIDKNTGGVSKNSKRISNIEKLLQGNLYDYDTDDDVAYVKDVPSGALPYAGVEKVGGKTLVWNQLVNSGTTTVATISGHKYYTLIDGTASIVTSSGSAITIVDDSVDMVCDLTLMFGAGNEPSTVAEFEAMFPAQYYPYSAPMFLHTKVTGVKVTGKNLCNFADGQGYPSSTSQAPTNKRIFELGKYVVGMDYNNNYSTSLTSATVIGEEIIVTRTGGSHYGVGIPFRCIPNTKYTISAVKETSVSGDARIYVSWYEADGTYISGEFTVDASLTATAPANANTGFVILAASASGLQATYKDIQVELGETATAYERYKNVEYSVPAQVQALDGYGYGIGSASGYIDYNNRVFVKCVDVVDLGSLAWTLNTSGTESYFSANLSASAPSGSGIATGNILCLNYTTVASNFISQTGYDKCIAHSASNKNIYVQDSAYATATDFKAAMSGVYLYFELASYDLTDISQYIVNDNIIEVESGDILTFENQNGADYHIPVPSTETYMIDLQEAIENGN